MELVNDALKAVTVMESAYQRIRQMILAGTIPIGERLDERKLSLSMEISRTPVRDAIGKLHKEGLVEYRPHQGNYVRRLSVKDINDLYAVRIELESLAVRLAAEKITAAEIEELRSIVGDSEIALNDGDLQRFGAADEKMHDFFIIRADNWVIKDSLRRIELLIQLARNLANRHPGFPEETNVQRHMLLDSLIAGDVEAAVTLMRIHIDSVRVALVEEIVGLEQLPIGRTE